MKPGDRVKMSALALKANLDARGIKTGVVVSVAGGAVWVQRDGLKYSQPYSIEYWEVDHKVKDA